MSIQLTGFEPVSELAMLLRSGKISASDVVSGLEARIKRREDLNCWINVDLPQLKRQATALDRLLASGHEPGPLHGIPVAIKDNIEAAGFPITGGSHALVGRQSSEDAPVVRALREAGALIVGKTNLYELGAGDPAFGEVRNPWDLERSAGASSSGSASAVAAGLSVLALGTDSGGSVRMPAASCGLVGVKPTYGLLSRTGTLGGAYSLDGVGLMARDVHGAALGLDVMAGSASISRWHEVAPRIQGGVAGLRVGLHRKQRGEHVSSEVAAGVDQTASVLEAAGAELVAVELPDLVDARSIWFAILMAENAESFSDIFRDHAAELSPGARWMLGSGRLLTATTYVHSQRLRAAINAEMAALFRRIDVLLLPTMPLPAWVIGRPMTEYDGISESELMAISRYAPLFNLTGQPAASIPAGFTSGGLPVGVQIAGKPQDEATVMRAAWVCEQALRWTARTPPPAALESQAN